MNDAVPGRPATAPGVDALARRHACTPIPVFLDCPPEVARGRIADEIAHNQHVARDRTPELVYEVQARFDAPPANALVIDATLPAAEVCRITVEAVAAAMKPRATA